MIANEFFLTFLVITEPAATIEFFSNLTGATRAELEPTKTLSDILVLDKPLVVRLEGTNVEDGKRILDQSDIKVITASDLDDAASKVVNLVEG